MALLLEHASWLFTLFAIGTTLASPQLYPDDYGYYPPRNPYGPYGQNPYEPYNRPNPGDRDYRTFTFNNRRYGQYQPSGYNGRGQPGDPNRIGQDVRFKYDEEGNAEPILPGILGGWREDLQGKQRPDSIIKDRDIFVKTTHGEVQGFKVYLYDNPDPDSLYRPGSTFIEREQGVTNVFLGVPYAQPPINEGRFKPPRPNKGWQLLQATDFGPACPQPVEHTGATKGVRDMHEDCLYLNIYSPSIDGVSEKYPVMFYIHGGDFVRGASNLFSGHIMATFYKVVVVTINYRLGALGFLSTADVNSPGNYGILDQSMALRWIYDNIENFNGDRNSITLFGPGAGAASAGLLMVAPETRHMVTKVIGQSGSSLADWAFISDRYRVQNTSRVFGQLLGCSIESSWKLVNCMRQGRSFYDLGNTEFPPDIGLFPFGPVVDFNLTMPYYEGWQEREWHFMPETPEALLRKGFFNKRLKYMATLTMHEASDFIYKNKSLSPDYIVTEKFFDQKIHELVLRYNYTLNSNGTYEAIKYMYTYHPDPHNVTHIREKYIEMLSDFLYVAPNDKMIKILVDQHIPVYMYVLNTTVESFKTDFWRRTPHDIEHWLLSGAPFMDVEFFPPKEGFERIQWTDNDRNMSHFFMKAYTDFARFGNPSHTQILGLHFEQARVGWLKYLNLNTTYNSSIMWNYRQTESAFWTSYLPTVVGHLIPTYPPTTEYWYEASSPLQIAFYSMLFTCIFLIVLLVVCCMLWRNAKRKSDFYNGDLFMVPDGEGDMGIENEYTDKPRLMASAFGSQVGRSESAASFQTSSAGYSSKELQELTPSFGPNGAASDLTSRKGTPILGKKSRTKTQIVQGGIPQTDV